MADATASAILNAGRAIPYELSVAYEKFVAALNEAIDRDRQNLRFCASEEVIDAIERFVHELQLNAAWFDELKRRATLVESLWVYTSPYSIARIAALKSDTVAPTDAPRGQDGLGCVRSESASQPHTLDDVIGIRKGIESILEDPAMELDPDARNAFGEWMDVCRQFQLDTQRLAVEGCNFLYHAYLGEAFRCDAPSYWKNRILKANFGAVHFEAIRDAGHSMVAWVVEEQLSRTAKQSGGGQIQDEGEVTKSRTEWPPDDKWHFEAASFWFRRVRYDLSGKVLELLKYMVKSRHTQFKSDTLFDAVWGSECPSGPNVVRVTLGIVRKALRLVANDIVADDVTCANPLPVTRGSGWKFLLAKS